MDSRIHLFGVYGRHQQSPISKVHHGSVVPKLLLRGGLRDMSGRNKTQRQKCGHGPWEGGQPRYATSFSPPSSRHPLAKIAVFSRYQTDTFSGQISKSWLPSLAWMTPNPKLPTPQPRLASACHCRYLSTKIPTYLRLSSQHHTVATMATQQILFAETIAGMKKAFKRKVYESDSDTEIESYSNRGNKLKKRARFAHQGQLVPKDGPSSYREFVEYSGVRRPIIYRNPPLIDDEGYEIDSDDDDERVAEAEAFAAEVNPYSNVQLENILAPLTSATGLPTHPTLSKPFLTKTLTKLVDQSCDNMRKENYSLWQVRHLLTSLCGDHTWVPCENIVRSSDVDLYSDNHVALHLLSLSQAHTGTQEALPSSTLGNSPQGLNGNEVNHQFNAPSGSHESDSSATEDADVSMADADAGSQPNGSRSGIEKPNEVKDKEANGPSSTPISKHKDSEVKAGPGVGAEHKSDNDLQKTADQKRSGDDYAVATTSAQSGEGDAAIDGQPNKAVNGGPNEPLVKALHESFVHPIFLAPSGTKPDRDVGLPQREAEDIRRLLALYVQKQEEVCRGAKKLYLGLLRAEQLRKEVWHWSKAEAHSGPNRDMSDGEDWYDKEEWGLTEDLKKGQDEEEEDTQTTGKKTRNRRA
ncbi:RXT2-like protein [Mariannaea sp. PMI_226]|nr:RXT2-like protein [Mariannaea sp. PMI_226]